MVFSLGCLKKSLLALVAVSLLVSIGQLVLIFINNKIFGALMFVLYILFFLAILLALCRDSVSMYSAAAILLIVFVIGCTLIQAYDVEVKDLLKLSEDEKEEGGGGGAATTTARYKRSDLMYQLLQSDAQWKPQDPVTWESAEDRLPLYPLNPQPIPMDVQPDPGLNPPAYDFQPAPSLPPQPTMLTMTVPEAPTAPAPTEPGPRELENEDLARWPWRDEKKDDKTEKKYRWRNELRWVSNVLGVLHILILAVVICILYEMLFGGKYRYRTWC